MRAKQAVWAERVRAWQESGKTLEEFSAGQPYKPLTLRWWASELRRRDRAGSGRGRKPRAATSIKLARVVRRAAPQPETRPLAVEVSGARIMVERGFDAALLFDVVRALGGGR